jgi:hypothetical protein
VHNSQEIIGGTVAPAFLQRSVYNEGQTQLINLPIQSTEEVRREIKKETIREEEDDNDGKEDGEVRRVKEANCNHM